MKRRRPPLPRTPPPKRPRLPAGTKAEADLRDRIAKTAMTEMKLAIMKGKYILREDKDQMETNIGLEVRKAVLAFAKRLPPLVHGLQEVREVFDVVMREAEAMLTAITRKRELPAKGRRGPGRPRKE